MILVNKKLRRIFAIRKDTTLSNRIKEIKIKKISRKVNRINSTIIKKAALDEMLTTKKCRMYKLFCQCVVLTGRIE